MPKATKTIPSPPSLGPERLPVEPSGGIAATEDTGWHERPEALVRATDEASTAAQGQAATSESVLAVITVHFDIFLTSTNRLPRHPQQRSKVLKDARLVGYRAWQMAGSPQFDFPVRVETVVRRGRRLDPGPNLYGAMKSIADGVFVGLESYLVIGGKRRRFRDPAMLQDDGDLWLTWEGVTQETGKAWANQPAVIFTIRRREGP